MSIKLPYLPRRDGIRKNQTVDFRGLNHRLGAGDGDLWDMQNLCGDEYPVLSPRPGRHIIRKLTKPNGIHGSDGLYYVDGTTLYKDGEALGQVADSYKQFADLPYYLVIWPDKVMYNKKKKALEPMGKTWTGSVTIQNGTYAGREAKANTIHGAVDWSTIFVVGDSVEITGCTRHPENNKTVVIQEIEGGDLRFLENTFTLDGNSPDTETVTMTIKIPDMDFICGHSNRLWGCKGDMIYASTPGQPWNFNSFMGTEEDSWFAEAGSAGDFTACFSYRGFPVFCKEDNIYKVYGDLPSNYGCMGAATLGVEAGSAGSVAIAAERAFFLTRAGIVSYTGGIPQPISAPFGDLRFADAVAGADGLRYFASMKDQTGRWRLYVYDTRMGMWHIEDDTHALGFAFSGELYCLQEDGTIWMDGRAREVPAGATPEPTVKSIAEFADFVRGDPNKKGTSKLQLRMELDAGSRVKVEIMFDSDGKWITVKELETMVKRSVYLPIIPRRSDHYRIRISASGGYKLYSLVTEDYHGSAMRSRK